MTKATLLISTFIFIAVGGCSSSTNPDLMRGFSDEPLPIVCSGKTINESVLLEQLEAPARGYLDQTPTMKRLVDVIDYTNPGVEYKVTDDGQLLKLFYSYTLIGMATYDVGGVVLVVEPCAEEILGSGYWSGP